MIRPPPRSPLFPSTPLSRSQDPAVQRPAHADRCRRRRSRGPDDANNADAVEPDAEVSFVTKDLASILPKAKLAARSEEHTSELQSPDHLVCRLLLEKKKGNYLRFLEKEMAAHPGQVPANPSTQLERGTALGTGLKVVLDADLPHHARLQTTHSPTLHQS